MVVIAALSACASKQDLPTFKETIDEKGNGSGNGIEWRLSPQAQVTYYFLEALDHIASNDYDRAALALEKALVIAPDPRLYVELALVYWRQDKPSQALSTLDKGIDRFPLNPDLNFLLAEFYLGQNKNVEAVQTLEQYKEMVPDDIRVNEELASLYLELQDYARAVDLLEAVPGELRTPEMYYYLGRATNELGDSKKAVEYLQKAVRQRPGFLQAWAEKAFIFEQKRDYLQAERTYQQLLKLGEKNPDLIMRIVELNLLLNDPDRAMDMLAIGPEHVYFQLDALQHFVRNGFYQHARVVLENILQRADYPHIVYFYLALIAYESDDDQDKALYYLNEIPEDDYYYLQAISFKLRIYFQQERYMRALNLAREGQDLYPEESRMYFFEAIILETLEKLEQALEVLDRALDKWPGNTDLLFRKGVVLDKMDRKDECIQVMEEIILIDQDHHEALNYVGYTLAEQNRDLERALILIKRALKLDPGNGYYIDSLAWVYYQQGEYSMAWHEIRRAVDYVDNDPVIWEHYGDIAKALSKLDKALHGYELALKLDSENQQRLREQVDKIRSMLKNPSRAAVP